MSKDMAKFPANVVNDILVHLPVKSLVRFKSVSKPWGSLISTPDFIKRHLKLSTETYSNLNLILGDGDVWAVDFDSLRKAVRIDCPFKSSDNGSIVMGSCNGLLCIGKSEKDVTFWNPFIRAHHVLPESPIEVRPSFPFDHSPIKYGFGYDPINDDYKVLRLVLVYGQVIDTFECEVKLYSLKTNSWKRITDVPITLSMLSDPDHSYGYNTGSGLCVDGALYWVMNLRNFRYKHVFIIAFDFRDEKFHDVRRPAFEHEDFHVNPAVLDGKFCLMCNHGKVHVDLWVMMESGVAESWVKLFSIVKDRLGNLTPLAYSKGRDKLLLEQDGKKLLWYDLKSKSFKKVKIRGGAPRSFGADMLQTSLVSPNVGGGRDGRNQHSHEEKKKKNTKKRDNFLSTGFKLKL